MADDRRLTIAAEESIAAFQLQTLAHGNLLNERGGNREVPDEIVTQNLDASRRDRAHRELWMAGDAKLAHQKHVERRAERRGHFKGDRHAAARQGQREDVRSSGVLGQLCRELTSRINAIVKAHPGYRIGLDRSSSTPQRA